MQFIILHSSSLNAQRVAVVIDAIKATGAKLLDDAQKTYLFDGDVTKAKEIIDPFVGEWSITPIRTLCP